MASAARIVMREVVGVVVRGVVKIVVGRVGGVVMGRVIRMLMVWGVMGSAEVMGVEVPV